MNKAVSSSIVIFTDEPPAEHSPRCQTRNARRMLLAPFSGTLAVRLRFHYTPTGPRIGVRSVMFPELSFATIRLYRNLLIQARSRQHRAEVERDGAEGVRPRRVCLCVTRHRRGVLGPDTRWRYGPPNRTTTYSQGPPHNITWLGLPISLEGTPHSPVDAGKAASFATRKAVDAGKAAPIRHPYQSVPAPQTLKTNCHRHLQDQGRGDSRTRTGCDQRVGPLPPCRVSGGRPWRSAPSWQGCVEPHSHKACTDPPHNLHSPPVRVWTPGVFLWAPVTSRERWPTPPRLSRPGAPAGTATRTPLPPAPYQ